MKRATLLLASLRAEGSTLAAFPYRDRDSVQSGWESPKRGFRRAVRNGRCCLRSGSPSQSNFSISGPYSSGKPSVMYLYGHLRTNRDTLMRFRFTFYFALRFQVSGNCVPMGKSVLMGDFIQVDLFMEMQLKPDRKIFDPHKFRILFQFRGIGEKSSR